MDKEVILLPVQKTNFDCGVGAALAASDILGFNYSYEDIFKALSPTRETGTDHVVLWEWCRDRLSAINHGESIYKSGVAILNITMSKVGHYVLAIGKSGCAIRFWCTWTGLLVEADERELHWINGGKTTLKWSVNINNKDYFSCSDVFYASDKTIYNGSVHDGIVSYQQYKKMVDGIEDMSIKTSLLEE